MVEIKRKKLSQILSPEAKQAAGAFAGSCTSEPLWKGPSVDGISFSLLNRFLACRERFRILMVEGLKPVDEFNHNLEYGNMWHICEEMHALRTDEGTTQDYYLPIWKQALRGYYEGCLKRYPTQQETVTKWYNVCKIQFPIYVDYWAKHKDMKKRESLLSEMSFKVPYTLPSGRTVLLRGKWDSNDIVREGRHDEIWLQENKTKGYIDEQRIGRQLNFDLQTMIYLTALTRYKEIGEHTQKPGEREPSKWMGLPIAGVRYNVSRRPYSGVGPRDLLKATKKAPAETPDEICVRVGEYILEDPTKWFYRWNVRVSSQEILHFRRNCLDPILQQLCDWWDHIVWCRKWSFDPFVATGAGLHWTAPFGTYNPLEDGGASELDNYIQTGNRVGLHRTESLFPELEPVTYGIPNALPQGE